MRPHGSNILGSCVAVTMMLTLLVLFLVVVLSGAS
jgi:hypothetical protein